MSLFLRRYSHSMSFTTVACSILPPYLNTPASGIRSFASGLLLPCLLIDDASSTTSNAEPCRFLIFADALPVPIVRPAVPTGPHASIPCNFRLCLLFKDRMIPLADASHGPYVRRFELIRCIFPIRPVLA